MVFSLILITSEVLDSPIIWTSERGPYFFQGWGVFYFPWEWLSLQLALQSITSFNKWHCNQHNIPPHGLLFMDGYLLRVPFWFRILVGKFWGQITPFLHLNHFRVYNKREVTAMNRSGKHIANNISFGQDCHFSWGINAVGRGKKPMKISLISITKNHKLHEKI